MNTNCLKKPARIFGSVGILVFCLVISAQGAFPTKQDVIDTMRLVNDYWIGSHTDPGDNKWSRATYFEGNMAFYAVYPDQRYYNYALALGGVARLGVERERYDPQCRQPVCRADVISN